VSTFLTNFDDTEETVPVEQEYATTRDFWGATQAPQPTLVPTVESGKKLNEIVDPEGD